MYCDKKKTALSENATSKAQVVRFWQIRCAESMTFRFQVKRFAEIFYNLLRLPYKPAVINELLETLDVKIHFRVINLPTN